MNEVIKALLERRSCKKYKADPVPQELIEQVIEAGLYAASGMGKQSPIVVAVTDKKLRDRLSEVNAEIRGNAGQDMFYGAPVVLAVAHDKENVFEYPGGAYNSGAEDAAIVATHLVLAAKSVGLDTCWLNFFDPDKAKELLQLPKNEELTILIDVGYPDAAAKPLPNHDSRKPLSETVTYR